MVLAIQIIHGRFKSGFTLAIKYIVLISDTIKFYDWIKYFTALTLCVQWFSFFIFVLLVIQSYVLRDKEIETMYWSPE